MGCIVTICLNKWIYQCHDDVGPVRITGDDLLRGDLARLIGAPGENIAD